MCHYQTYVTYSEKKKNNTRLLFATNKGLDTQKNVSAARGEALTSSTNLENILLMAFSASSYYSHFAFIFKTHSYHCVDYLFSVVEYVFHQKGLWQHQLH